MLASLCGERICSINSESMSTPVASKPRLANQSARTPVPHPTSSTDAGALPSSARTPRKRSRSPASRLWPAPPRSRIRAARSAVDGPLPRGWCATRDTLAHRVKRPGTGFRVESGDVWRSLSNRDRAMDPWPPHQHVRCLRILCGCWEGLGTAHRPVPGAGVGACGLWGSRARNFNGGAPDPDRLVFRRHTDGAKLRDESGRTWSAPHSLVLCLGARHWSASSRWRLSYL